MPVRDLLACLRLGADAASPLATWGRLGRLCPHPWQVLEEPARSALSPPSPSFWCITLFLTPSCFCTPHALFDHGRSWWRPRTSFTTHARTIFNTCPLPPLTTTTGAGGDRALRAAQRRPGGGAAAREAGGQPALLLPHAPGQDAPLLRVDQGQGPAGELAMTCLHVCNRWIRCMQILRAAPCLLFMRPRLQRLAWLFPDCSCAPAPRLSHGQAFLKCSLVCHMHSFSPAIGAAPAQRGACRWAAGVEGRGAAGGEETSGGAWSCCARGAAGPLQQLC